MAVAFACSESAASFLWLLVLPALRAPHLICGFLACFRLQRHAILEDGDLAISVLLVACGLSAGNVDDLTCQLVYELGHGRSLNERTSVEVDPVGLPGGEMAVGGNLHCGHKCAEGRASACGEEYQLASRSG